MFIGIRKVGFSVDIIISQMFPRKYLPKHTNNFIDRDIETCMYLSFIKSDLQWNKQLVVYTIHEKIRLP